MAHLLTHWGRDKMVAIFQTAFSNEFSWTKMYEFHQSLFPRFQLTIIQHWFRQCLGAGQATSHCLNQWWLISLLMDICVTRPQWVNPFLLLLQAIRDGVIEATIDHENGYVQSKENSDIYSTKEPMTAFHQRICFCLDIHNQSVKVGIEILFCHLVWILI